MIEIIDDWGRDNDVNGYHKRGGGVYCINYNIQNGGSSSNNGSGYKLVLESWSGQLLR